MLFAVELNTQLYPQMKLNKTCQKTSRPNIPLSVHYSFFLNFFNCYEISRHTSIHLYCSSYTRISHEEVIYETQCVPIIINMQFFLYPSNHLFQEDWRFFPIWKGWMVLYDSIIVGIILSLLTNLWYTVRLGASSEQSLTTFHEPWRDEKPNVADWKALSFESRTSYFVGWICLNNFYTLWFKESPSTLLLEIMWRKSKAINLLKITISQSKNLSNTFK